MKRCDIMEDHGHLTTVYSSMKVSVDTATPGPHGSILFVQSRAVNEPFLNALGSASLAWVCTA